MASAPPRPLRPILAVALLGIGGVSSTPAQDPPPRLSSWSETAQLEWWRDHPEPASQHGGLATLCASLRRAQEQHGLERAFANRHFTRWLTHALWLSLYPAPAEADPYFGTAEAHDAFRRASAIPGLAALTVRSMSTRDARPRALEVLCRIAADHPGDLAAYPELAVAFALVWDQPFPEGWPHANVGIDAVPAGDPDPAGRFAFTVASHREDKLLLDPRSLSVRELTFAVDTPVELRELAYVQQVEIATIAKLEGLYRAVPYDHGRIAAESYGWPHGRYRLIDIGKKGGICMDQAYFVAHTGKAKGVPTVLFTGQGRSGDHAWLGYLTGRGRWTLDAAKWRGENYPTGHAFDPQTWRRFTDAQMEYAVKGSSDSPSAARGKLILGWAALNAGQPFYRDLLRAAQAAMPRGFEAWELEAELLVKAGAAPEERRAFWQRWVANFAGERDMKAKGQRALLRVLRELGDDDAADRLGRQIVAENKSSRFDLGIAVAADEVFALQARGEHEEAAKEYGRVMRRFKRDAGGHLFYNLVEPYTRACLSAARRDDAQEAVAIAGEVLTPQPGSILDNDFRALHAEVDSP